jgi:hypothetical protein
MSSMLDMLQVEKEDQGNYECIVTDHSGNSRNKREFIRCVSWRCENEVNFFLEE